MAEIKGRVHSIESCGTVDGPGIRFVTFMQGCPLRCQYCHNADTWATYGGTEYTPEELMEQIVKYKSYMRFSGGGVTFTGGEPLLQSDFLKEMFKLCKKQGIHIALDTSGFLYSEKTKETIDMADMVLLDIKNFDPEVYKEVTSVSLEPTLKFLEHLREKNIECWVRYVLVPNLTDNIDAIEKMADYLKDFPNVTMIEVLPFHKMGEFKWEELGREYKLKDTEPPAKEAVEQVKEILRKSGKQVR